jgi:hypothetical protein
MIKDFGYSQTARTYRFDLKQWAASVHIPPKNLRYFKHREQMHEGLLEAVSVMLAAKKDEVSSDTKTTGKVPKSLSAWLTLYFLIVFPFMRRWMEVETVPTVTTRNEIWRVCPHVPMQPDDSILSHIHFVEYGGDFDKLTDNRRLAAQQVLQAALRVADDRDPFPRHLSAELMYAVRLYREGNA